MIGFSHLVVLADPLSLQVVRELEVKATQLQASTGASIVLRPVMNLADALGGRQLPLSYTKQVTRIARENST